MTTITEYLAEQKRLAEAATKGPWEADGCEVSQHWSRPEPWLPIATNEVACMAYCYGGSARGIEREADAEFIAAARESVPRLVGALEAVTALHRRDPYIPEGKRPWCVCEEPWPCPTISVVEAALGGETDG